MRWSSLLHQAGSLRCARARERFHALVQKTVTKSGARARAQGINPETREYYKSEGEDQKRVNVYRNRALLELALEEGHAAAAREAAAMVDDDSLVAARDSILISLPQT